MSWTKLMALGVAAAAMTAPALAEVIVVKASGPSAAGYPAGRKLPDRSTVSLKNGDMLIVLDGQGTRTLRGPGTFGTNAPPTAGSSTRSALTALISPRAGSRPRTGAVRTGEVETGPPRSPNLWYVDISQSATICVADPTNVILWRPDSKADAIVTAAGGGKSATISFAAGAPTAPWPVDKLPVADKASYSLSWPGAPAPTQIGFSILSGQTEGLESMASTLISRRCNAQLNLLVEAVQLPEPAPIAPTG